MTATLDGTWPTDTDITLAVAGSGETNVVGFAAVEDIVLTVPAFARAATATFTLTPDDDAIDERDETVTVSGTVDAAPDLEVRPATLVLSDEEAASKPRGAVPLADSDLAEDGGATAVTVTATLDGDARSEDTAVAMTVRGSGDPGVVGFAPVAPFSLTIPTGHTSAAAVLTLVPEDDYIDETDETVTVAGTAALTVAPAVLTLTDDDATSTKLHWTISPLEIPEGAGPTEVTVTMRLDAAARTVDTELVGTARASDRNDISHPLSHSQATFKFNVICATRRASASRCGGCSAPAAAISPSSWTRANAGRPIPPWRWPRRGCAGCWCRRARRAASSWPRVATRSSCG